MQFGIRRLSVNAIILISILVLFSSCGLRYQEDADAAGRTGSEAPPVSVPDEDGRSSYQPTLPESTPNSPIIRDPSGEGDEDPTSNDEPHVPQERCKVKDIYQEVEPDSVDKEVITFVRSEVDFDEKVKAESDMIRSDHLHLVSVTLYVSSGDTLGFIDWMRIYGVDPDTESQKEIAWGTDFPDGNVAYLEVEGKEDLRHLIDEEGNVSLVARVFAKSPKEDTMMGANLMFRSFYDCVWE